MPFPEHEQTLDREDEQDMYDAQESMEDEEESDQELPDCLPMSCVTLTREYQDLLAKADRESCLEETRDYIEEAESDTEEEAQEEILPPSQLMREEEGCCSSVHDVRETPLLTEEEIDRILNQQSTPEIFYRTHTLAHSSCEFDHSDSEDSSVDQNEERPAENLIGLEGDITYNYDFPFYDQFDDDFFEREAELAGPSSLDSWEKTRASNFREVMKPVSLSMTLMRRAATIYQQMKSL